jgi:two-component system, sensor histidine kinase and response regulator
MAMLSEVPEDCQALAPLLDDRTALLRSVGGHMDLLREIVDIYLESVPRLLQEVRAALVMGNQSGLFQAAHKLAGTVSAFYSSAAQALVLRVERQAEAGDLTAARVALPALEKTLGCLGEELRHLLAEMA